MELRLSAADLGRITVAQGADPELEYRLSLRMLRRPSLPCFVDWHGEMSQRFRYRELTDRSGYERIAIEPYWDRIEKFVAAERVRLGRTLLDGGLDTLLATLHPEVRWDSPRLRVNGSADEMTAEGGLLVQPSVFTGHHPMLVRRAGQAVLVLPVSCELEDLADEQLGALMGRTRAKLIKMLMLAGGATTTQLARRADLSLAAVSQHVAVLRSVGLVVTQNAGRERCHLLTPAGARLVDRPVCS
ncbi:MAG: helix-turn-helix transcriptional regulator [Hamadaea sp.]|uniref:ArsR/SmtB family transcription factor n=1 Tax=Hamadaea sp. TaxID=2024425 RepID=UPI00185AB1CB|nr:winged helix-turn-helix domain-containing protein [Hamadaea sp.]NUR74077.1 helix-turn-helix transcriptional regulator [Hamadaea sp.]NUT23969.1 helix-turn-helix transcriptional regulator [Hamadaea sp.]